MSEWKECTLGDIVTFQRGFDITKKEQFPGSYPVVSSSGINSYHNAYKVKCPGVVIGRKGTLGTVFYLNKDFWPHDTTLWVKNFHGNYPLFIFYFLKGYNFQQYDVGSSNPTLNRNHIHLLPSLIPPLPEQRAIASVLSSLDDKIDMLHRQNKTLEAMAETLFRQWFVEEEDEGWEEGKLGNCASVTTGKGLKRHEFIDNGMYPVLGANGEIGRTNNYLTDDRLILTGRVGTLGKVIISDDKVWISDNVLIVKPNKIKYFYPIYFILKRTEFENLNVGSTQPLVTQTDLKNINFILPHNYILENFENNCLIYYEKKSKNDTQIRTLEKLRDTLLPKLMSGEVRVKLEQEGGGI